MLFMTGAGGHKSGSAAQVRLCAALTGMRRGLLLPRVLQSRARVSIPGGVPALFACCSAPLKRTSGGELRERSTHYVVDTIWSLCVCASYALYVLPLLQC